MLVAQNPCKKRIRLLLCIKPWITLNKQSENIYKNLLIKFSHSVTLMKIDSLQQTVWIIKPLASFSVKTSAIYSAKNDKNMIYILYAHGKYLSSFHTLESIVSHAPDLKATRFHTVDHLSIDSRVKTHWFMHTNTQLVKKIYPCLSLGYFTIPSAQTMIDQAHDQWSNNTLSI